jgi:hypothetical protein
VSKFLKAKHSRFVVRKREIRDSRTGKPKESGARGRGELKAGGVSGVAAESRFGFQTSPVDFKQIWSDDLP